jgi:hypothetical protein
MRAAVVRLPKRERASEALTARSYPSRVPDGEYTALCTHVYHDQHSRSYGERVYLDFQIYLGDHAGETIRMFLRPSKFPTSNYYRSWAMARGGPPSRNAKMSARVFVGKMFKVLTSTVKPKHRITGEDGKMRPGPFLPESLWYSKVACILSLEATNDNIVELSAPVTEAGGRCPPRPPVFVTDFSNKPFSNSKIAEGRAGRRELGDGRWE